MRTIYIAEWVGLRRRRELAGNGTRGPMLSTRWRDGDCSGLLFVGSQNVSSFVGLVIASIEAIPTKDPYAGTLRGERRPNGVRAPQGRCNNRISDFWGRHVRARPVFLRRGRRTYRRGPLTAARRLSEKPNVLTEPLDARQHVWRNAVAIEETIVASDAVVHATVTANKRRLPKT